MNTKFFWLSIVAVILSFIGGFFIANSLNRNSLNALQAENEQLKKQVPANQNSENAQLSDEEIKQRIAEADKNPENFEFQKSLGLALYRYASINQNPELMTDVQRLIERANKLKPEDYEVLVALGNVHFDLGYFKKDNAQFDKAREIYLSALKEKPKDENVRTDYGLTYFLKTPPDYDTAIAEFNKSLELNPKHERTLQVMVEAYANQGKKQEAEKYLAKLEEVNPQNSTLPALKNKVAQSINQPLNK